MKAAPVCAGGLNRVAARFGAPPSLRILPQRPALHRPLHAPASAPRLRPAARALSTMAARQSGADHGAAPAAKEAYDPEILDIASYVHNYRIDSELAVRNTPVRPTRPSMY